MIYILNKESSIVISYSGEKKEQEDYLGYRFSKSRGQEGLEILYNDDGSIATKMFSSNRKHEETKVAFYIREAFVGNTHDINEEVEKHLQYKNIASLIKFSNSLIIDNPSKHFTSNRIKIESNSPFGDFIDNYKQKKLSLKKLLSSDKLFYDSGLIYNKTEAEVPYETKNRVLTASNLDLKSASIVLEDKMIYLKEGYPVPSELKPKKNDIIISNASGSLTHLGKVAWVDVDYPEYVIGGFLGIYRFRDLKIAKAVFYRLMSLRFRKYIWSLRGQNINNLDFDKVDSFGIQIPKDLNTFYKEVVKKEKELKEIRKKLLSLHL